MVHSSWDSETWQVVRTKVSHGEYPMMVRRWWDTVLRTMVTSKPFAGHRKRGWWGSVVSPGVPLPETWSQTEAMPRAMYAREGHKALRDDFIRWQAPTGASQDRNEQQTLAGGHASGQILFDHGRLFFKTPAGLVCAEATTGRVLWRG